MSGHGNWSGQGKRSKRDSDNNSEAFESYASGRYGADYDNLSVDDINVKLIQERNVGLLMNNYSEESQREMAKVADAIARDFPILQNAGGNIDSEDDSSMSRAIAWADVNSPLRGGTAKVTFHDRFMGLSPNEALEQWSTQRGGFHFPNNGIGAVTAHELGHNIEALIINSKHSNGWEIHEDWVNGSTARRIVENAARSLNLSELRSLRGLNSQGVADLLGTRVSGYAQHDIHETIAEAFGDCFANGRNASPLSIAIYKETRRYARTLAS